MSRAWRVVLAVSLVAALIVAGGLVAAFGRSGGGPVAAESAASQRAITVAGMGSVSVVPDTAQVVLGATEHNADLGQAQQTVNQKMDAILAALKQAGIPESDIRTTQYNVSVDRKPDDPSAGITGYTVTHLVQVKIKPLDKVNGIIDAVVAQGANAVYDVTFTVEDQNAALRQAREQAMADAKDKAQQLAQLGGVTLGPVVSISEGVSQPPTPLTQSRPAAGAADTAIQPGQTELTVNLTVSFGIQ